MKGIYYGFPTASSSLNENGQTGRPDNSRAELTALRLRAVHRNDSVNWPTEFHPKKDR